VKLENNNFEVTTVFDLLIALFDVISFQEVNTQGSSRVNKSIPALALTVSPHPHSFLFIPLTSRLIRDNESGVLQQQKQKSNYQFHHTSGISDLTDTS
jgi:hypothetical protein